jgi:hypothetical protein
MSSGRRINIGDDPDENTGHGLISSMAVEEMYV